MNFKVSAKLASTSKWWQFGSIKKNQYGNLSLSFKNTQQLKDFVNNGGEWLNFALFEEEQKQTPHNQAKADGYQYTPALPDDSQDLPF